MSDTSRRKFLAAAGAGAAAVPVVAMSGGAAEAAPSARAAKEAVVAYVEDPKAGVLTLMVGEREIVVEDRDLVTRILNAAGGAR